MSLLQLLMGLPRAGGEEFGSVGYGFFCGRMMPKGASQRTLDFWRSPPEASELVQE
jgi:hypothetical protein